MLRWIKSTLFRGVAKPYLMMFAYKHKSGAQKRQDKKETISKIRKTTHKIDTIFAKKATSSEQVKDAADFGLQDKVSTAAETPSESEITFHSAVPLDLSQPDETKFDGPPAKVSRPDSMTTSTQITPAKSAYFLKPDTSHNASISQEMFWKFHPNQPVSNIPFNSAAVYDRQGIQGMNINRKWVTYNEENKTLHCSFCLRYALEKSRNMQMIQAVLTGDTSQQDCLNMKRATVISIPLMHIF